MGMELCWEQRTESKSREQMMFFRVAFCIGLERSDCTTRGPGAKALCPLHQARVRTAMICG